MVVCRTGGIRRRAAGDPSRGGSRGDKVTSPERRKKRRVKIVLSRKGFDSSAGGCASPIVDGRLVSLPIPDPDSCITYAQVRHEAIGALDQVVTDLTRGRVGGKHGAHLDPDLDHMATTRLRGWRPVFGQVDAAQSHLASHGIGKDDLFLMFGWFREAEKVRGRYRFTPGAPNVHMLYGWFQIGEVFELGSAPQKRHFPKWAHYHPHFYGKRGRNNVIYVASDRLRLNDVDTRMFGAGRFPVHAPQLQLTAPASHKRSLWKMPAWFNPTRHHAPLSYHYDRKRWTRRAGGYLLQSAGRGQEFVFDTAVYPEAIDWVQQLCAASM